MHKELTRSDDLTSHTVSSLLCGNATSFENKSGFTRLFFNL
ncbi:hypothetical protein VCRA2113O415_170069 [Vibrio crassostreae]|nr:hypothetical protein VCRA2110O182_10834 [Vibrio crassostreae]CAK2421588.1 hypothetical protein VCRA2113O415_170069 [Vibrio crassostreae]CAK3357946.1 hypothetical protein VCRA2121O436_20069 [Vibrio crassostreae]CAK3443601.1 hypothetical protein VCRA2123O443_50167 [Vibrio crassostreae]